MPFPNVLVGCDPELFVSQDGEFASAHGLVSGTKENPLKVYRGAVQVDGMALEINTEPAQSEDEFVFNVQTVLDELQALVPSFKLHAVPSVRFPDKAIHTAPEEALELGCDPDFDAWTGDVNPAPDDSGNENLRTGAGHIHVGYTSGEDTGIGSHHYLDCCELVKYMELYVGIPLLLIEPESERGALYGVAGAFRPKSYGFEYRVPSNHWLTEEKLMRFVYSNTRLAMDAIMDNAISTQDMSIVHKIMTMPEEFTRDEIVTFLREMDVRYYE